MGILPQHLSKRILLQRLQPNTVERNLIQTAANAMSTSDDARLRQIIQFCHLRDLARDVATVDDVAAILSILGQAKCNKKSSWSQVVNVLHLLEPDRLKRLLEPLLDDMQRSLEISTTLSLDDALIHLAQNVIAKN